ncbi:hypothetical protein [Accumulibacter sp.]|uniref:hypothetical protein n=1 Tax=Accumulibacter sp. TaxID=2053492 RepID=UPI0025F08987|nr:hypothetical protein [Accumulibacter sp.]MCM8594973.1 hypothetical protein [Accumulibacter sp.]MCM8627296.1 hypothetical protein [Accumulibacter sp.]MDS4049119.1 hypothetical protein [Accumulibacter sp.]
MPYPDRKGAGTRGDAAARRTGGPQPRHRRPASLARLGASARAAALFAAACYDAACPLLEEQESLAREQNDPALLGKAVGNRGVIHRLRREHAAALADFHEKEALWRQVEDARELAGNLCNQALVLGDGLGRCAGALAKAEEAVWVASAFGLEQTLAEVQPLRDQLRAVTRSRLRPCHRSVADSAATGATAGLAPASPREVERFRAVRVGSLEPRPRLRSTGSLLRPGLAATL